MKTSLKTLILGAVAALGLSVAGNASAVSILNFNGSATLDENIKTANEFTEFFNATNGQSGELSVAKDSSGIFRNLTIGQAFSASAPLLFDPVSIIEPLFSLMGYFFTVNQSTVEFIQGGSVNFGSLTVFGSGTISGPSGFTAPAAFSLATSNTTPVLPGESVAIQGQISTPVDSIPVPEGGSAVLLLGLGMIGVETLRRRLVKNRA